MDDRELVQFVDFMLGRMQHLVRLASVTDPRAMVRYLAALDSYARPKFDALASSLDVEPVNLPN